MSLRPSWLELGLRSAHKNHLSIMKFLFVDHHDTLVLYFMTKKINIDLWDNAKKKKIPLLEWQYNYRWMLEVLLYETWRVCLLGNPKIVFFLFSSSSSLKWQQQQQQILITMRETQKKKKTRTLLNPLYFWAIPLWKRTLSKRSFFHKRILNMQLCQSVPINTGACGVMVIIVGNGHGNTSSNPGWDSLHFTQH